MGGLLAIYVRMLMGLIADLMGDCETLQSLSLSGSAGFLRPLNGDRTRVSDRFFIGGGTTMRGFVPRGLGVKDLKTGTNQPLEILLVAVKCLVCVCVLRW